jgi:hypothetical protein
MWKNGRNPTIFTSLQNRVVPSLYQEGQLSFAATSLYVVASFIVEFEILVVLKRKVGFFSVAHSLYWTLALVTMVFAWLARLAARES